MSRGLFVTFEGGEGTGKSTSIEAVNKKLLLQGLDTVQINDPGTTALSKKIRNLVKHDKEVEFCRRSELYLFCAARANMVSQIINPNLSKGNIVLCDRFSDSTLVYQGLVKGKADSLFLDILNYASYDVQPDLTFLFDMDVEEALARTTSRDFFDRFDSMDLSFHKNIRKYYQMVSERYKDRIVTVDASKSVEDISTFIFNTILDKISYR